MYPQPSRILSNGSTGTSISDLPYGNQPAAPREVNSFDDAEPTNPTETTSLLSSSARRIRPKSSPRLGRDGSDDPPSFNEAPAASPRARRRPISLRLSFLLACVLLYVNLSFLILTAVGVRSPFIANNALPPHFGSMFYPLWLTILSLLTNMLALFAFVVPNESPHLASWTAFMSAAALGVQLILILAVGQLRHRENVLTLVLIGIALLSTLHAGASAHLVFEYAPLLEAPVDLETREAPGFVASLKRVGSYLFTFFSVSLPIAVLHVAILASFALLTLSVILRSYDASLQPSGQLWKVNPWRTKTGGSTGVSEIGGRPYILHLACRGVDVEPIFAAGSNTTVAVTKNPTFVRRTVLVETEQGVPGVIGAAWIMDMLREGSFTSPDTDIRVCFYDRPGYGFSDNSPTSAVPHVVKALSHALQQAGEFARLEPNSHVTSDTSSVIPSPLARSGFVLVASGYGALSATLFASTHPQLVHSALYLNPIPPALHYASQYHSIGHALRSFAVDSLGSFASELGLVRIWSTLTGSSRATRVLSTEQKGLRAEIMRSYVQEKAEANNPSSKSARAWTNARSRYPERPSIVLSRNETRGSYGYGEDDNMFRFQPLRRTTSTSSNSSAASSSSSSSSYFGGIFVRKESGSSSSVETRLTSSSTSSFKSFWRGLVRGASKDSQGSTSQLEAAEARQLARRSQLRESRKTTFLCRKFVEATGLSVSKRLERRNSDSLRLIFTIGEFESLLVSCVNGRRGCLTALRHYIEAVLRTDFRMALFEACVEHLRESAELDAVHLIEDRSMISWRDLSTADLDLFIERMSTRLRQFSSASTARARASSEDHYENLGVSRTASKKEIRDKFYELSRKYHPDAPSTSTSESIESRTSRFQTISQSYHVLSDDSLRRSFDQSSSGSSYVRPSYSSARNQSGFGGGSAAAWNTTSSDNAARRDRANYAWMHPTRRRTGPTAAEAGASRPDPFQTDENDKTPMNDHFMRYAGRDAKARSRAAKFGTRKGSPFSSGTEGFGAKAEASLAFLLRQKVPRSCELTVSA
ncbi:hypothetical protein RQP46_000311 [Phenoliferia psychrophenolica]